ncbi:MAG: hypothetical protein P8J50_02565 [Acidimicrobiales bacterium]|nr:hypothetical protein [Acidimicrobiales bacterium]
MFAGAGVAHFARPDFFESIVPRWFPNPKLANQASGAAEIACGLAMAPRRTRRVAAFGLLAILAGVFPANLDMYLNDVDMEPGDDGKMERVENAEGVRTRNLVRLPFQFLFAFLVWRHTRRPRRPRRVLP